MPGGRISFLLPQSFRSGAYFEKLRTELAKTCDIVAITQFADQRNVFDDVNSPLMIVVLQKRAESEGTSDHKIQMRISANGRRLSETPAVYVPQNLVLRQNGHGPVWYLSDKVSDYDLLEKISYLAETQTSARGHFQFQNGGFVWNQHKQLLHQTQIQGAIPLIFSRSIDHFRLEFPAQRSTATLEKQFARSTAAVEHLKLAGPCVLVKRTTSKKWGHRITATSLPTSFRRKYPEFFSENHVNVILPINRLGLNLLPGLARWLNTTTRLRITTRL